MSSCLPLALFKVVGSSKTRALTSKDFLYHVQTRGTPWPLGTCTPTSRGT